MQRSLANASLASLAELGRRRGELTAAELQGVLPLDTMSCEDIAQAISDLEDQGIEITLSPDLLAPRPRSLPQLHVVGAEPANPMRVAEVRGRTFDHSVKVVPSPEEPRPGRLEVFSVALAGSIVCGVAAALVWGLG